MLAELLFQACPPPTPTVRGLKAANACAGDPLRPPPYELVPGAPFCAEWNAGLKPAEDDGGGRAGSEGCE